MGKICEKNIFVEIRSFKSSVNLNLFVVISQNKKSKQPYSLEERL